LIIDKGILMGLFSSKLTSKDIPHSIWKSETLYIPVALSDAHREFLKRRGWLAEYNPSVAGGKGGETEFEAREHVLHRFLNSAARMQYVCADPSDEQPEVRETLKKTFRFGEIAA
jgi:hypothetical protein